MIVLLKNECSLSGADNVRWRGHSNTTRWQQKLELFTLTGSGHIKTLRWAFTLALSETWWNFHYLIFKNGAYANKWWWWSHLIFTFAWSRWEFYMLLKRRCKRKHWVWTGLQKVHSHVTSAFAISLDLCRLVLENANVKCEHNHFLPLTLFLTFDTNLCKRKSYVWTRLCNGWTRSVSTPFWSNYIVTVVTVRNSSYGKVMFSQACVKNSVHSGGGGVCPIACWDTSP